NITSAVRSATMGLNGKADESKAEAFITVGETDEINFIKSTGGTKIAPLSISMAGKAIELKAGDPLSGASSIKIEPDGITFSSGRVGNMATMKISSAEITSKLGVTTVTQTMQDIQRSVAATTQEKLTAQDVKLEAMNQDLSIKLLRAIKLLKEDYQG